MQELMLAATLNLYAQQKRAEYEADGRRERLANSVKAESSQPTTAANRRWPLFPRLAGALRLS